MFSTLMGMFGGKIVEQLFGSISGIIERWQTKQISEVEAKKLITMALVDSVKQIEVTYAQELTKTYATLMGAVKDNKIVAFVWAVTAISQLMVLLWHQVGIPWMVYAYREYWGDPAFRYPSSGTTVEWSYALLGGLLGLGALALRSSSSTSLVDRMKSLVVK